ncbi:MAG: GNAT family N-acetyltransferase [Acidobacteriota bacterium]
MLETTAKQAKSTSEISAARALFEEYADWLGIDLCFQDFDAELQALPGNYSPPSGRLLLAWEEDEPVGCVALRRIDSAACEMKRLFVRPSHRSRGIGRKLAKAIICMASEIRYSRIRLDTLPSMGEARSLYVHLGFREIPPYTYNPVPGAVYMELSLPKTSTL